MNPGRVATLLLALVCLTACGWQLRGVAELDMEALELRGASQDLRAPLRRSLEDSGVAVTDGAEWSLRVLEEDFSERTVRVDERGRSAGLELRLEARWELRDAEGEARLTDQSVRVLRFLDVDPGRALATGDEKAAMEDDMYRDAALQILMQLQHLAPSSMEKEEH